MQIRSTHHALTPWHLLSKLNKDKNLSSPLEDGTGMKINEYNPQIPPSPVNILPLHLYAPHNHFHFHNQLAKETQSSSSSPVCLLSLWKRILAEINSHCTFLTFQVSLWILSCDEVRTSNTPRTVVLEMLKGRWGNGEGNGTPLQYSCLENPTDGGAWWAAVHGVAQSRTRLSDFTFTFHFHALEKEMATHSSVLAWRIPGTGEPGGLPSMGPHRVGHDWSDLAAAAADKGIWLRWLELVLSSSD